MIEKIVLMEAAYFYNYKRKISKTAMSKAFTNISTEKKAILF